jgi:hypothetical protein
MFDPFPFSITSVNLSGSQLSCPCFSIHIDDRYAYEAKNTPRVRPKLRVEEI